MYLWYFIFSLYIVYPWYITSVRGSCAELLVVLVSIVMLPERRGVPRSPISYKAIHTLNVSADIKVDEEKNSVYSTERSLWVTQ